MDLDKTYPDPGNVLEIAFSCDALFEQYDESEAAFQANDEMYENLYPNVA